MKYSKSIHFTTKHSQVTSLLFIVFCFSSINKGFTQDLYNFDNSRKFAEYLGKSGQFEMAAKEYERLVFLKPQNDSLKLDLMTSYRKARKVDFGILRTHQLFPEINAMPVSHAIEFSKMLINNELWNDANRFWEESRTLPKEDKILLKSTSEVYNYNFKRANELLNELPESQNSMENDYKSLVKQALTEKYKSPFLAASLSTVVPGLGKVYTGDWKDAIVSFIFIGGSAFQAYRGFADNGIKSTKGWVFGSIALGFHLGNIYGSAKAAKDYNKGKKHKIQHEIQKLFVNYF